MESETAIFLSAMAAMAITTYLFYKILICILCCSFLKKDDEDMKMNEFV